MKESVRLHIYSNLEFRHGGKRKLNGGKLSKQKRRKANLKQQFFLLNLFFVWASTLSASPSLSIGVFSALRPKVGQERMNEDRFHNPPTN